MINAKQEFLDHIKERCVGGRTVRCAKVSIHNLKNSVYSILPVGYTPEDQEEFLKEIDLDYDNVYCGQNLHGTLMVSSTRWLLWITMTVLKRTLSTSGSMGLLKSTRTRENQNEDCL